MAINAFDYCSSPTVKSVSSRATRRLNSGRITKLDDDWIKRSKTKKKKSSRLSSPYLQGEKIQLFSRMTEKRLVHKKNEVFSSYPMAANIYRASSDEFKALKKNRQKARKSVLTLPNVPAPIPKARTVSEMNEYDYLNNINYKKSNVPKTRLVNANNRRNRTKGFEFYDRDACYLCSSAEFDGKTYPSRPGSNKGDVCVQDVWSALRNINKFQFRPAPRISDEESFASNKKKKTVTKKFRNRKGRRLIETCRTEEVSYVANFEIQSKTSESPSSSLDRVTVISKLDNTLNKTNVDNAVEKRQNPQKIFKPKLIPQNERNIYNNTPKNNPRLTNARHYEAIIKKPNTQFTRIPGNNVVHKRPISPSTFLSIDSSNCLRPSENEVTLRPFLPNGVDAVFNAPTLSCANLLGKPLNNASSTEVTEYERMATGKTQMLMNNNNNLSFVLNKGLPKPRLVTTMPSAATMPKLTASDIKRRIAQIKFPLTILGRDQVSSSLEVYDYTPPQFDGLNNHIWPFMLEWKKKNSPKKYPPKSVDNSNLRKYNIETPFTKSRDRRIPYWDIAYKKKVDFKRPQQEVVPPLAQKKVKPMRQLKDKMLKILYKNNTNIKNTESKEPLNLVSNKFDASTDMSVIVEEDCQQLANPEESKNVSIVEPKVLRPNKAALVQRIHERSEDVAVKFHKPRNALEALNMKMPGVKYPWAKAKWASEFIENVIKKINEGVYYGIEEQTPKTLANYTVSILDNIKRKTVHSCHNTKEVSIQTHQLQNRVNKVDFGQNFSLSTHTLIENDEIDPLVKIPGFDDAPPNLEIKTLSSKEIQVKNCLTNVMINFDVSVPNQKGSGNSLEEKCSTSSFVPLVTTSSNTKVFKCSTTILNAVLPAELCTVLPKLMQSIFDSTTTIVSSSTASPNVTVSELSECDFELTPSLSSSSPVRDNPWSNRYHPRAKQNRTFTRQHKYWRYSPNSQWSHQEPQKSTGLCWVPLHGFPEYLPLHISSISPVLKELLEGRFKGLPHKCQSSKGSNFNVIRKIMLNWSENTILPKTVRIAFLLDPPKPLNCDRSKPDIKSIENPIEVVKPSECKALELYRGIRKEKWVPLFGNLTSLLQKVWSYCKFNIHNSDLSLNNSSVVGYNRDRNDIIVDMVGGNNYGVKTMVLSLQHVNTFYDNFGNCGFCEELKSITDNRESNNTMPNTKCVGNKKYIKKLKEKVRRRSYVKLYKKSKSTSSMVTASNDDKLSTPLNKITNMEEFTQALGAAKSLCSVFDGVSGQKVLKCIHMMKLWIKYITPNQAMLVLLLTNKKETVNLKRFSPVLLQGIAVNRITRAMELDMEIEVIETENLQVAQSEGINCISALVDNQDRLYDELCWIAKTTASDYQKVFNESSETLLKALIGKRKKLSPSYLRVMARYVGLGLVKTM